MKSPIFFALALMLSLGLLAQEAARESESTEKATAVPATIDFQGRLHDSGGSPVNATLNITFSLYDVLSGGTPLWTETKSVQVTDGLFQVKLGEVNPFLPTLFSGTNRWLGIKVGSEAEMSPRTKFSSVGYALQAIETDPSWEGGVNSVGSIGRTGFVGIGTLNPQTPLEVASTGIPHIRLTNNSAEGGFVQKITFWKNTAEKFAIGYDLWGEGDDLFTLFDTNGHGPVFNIKNGYVGINTTDPTALLHTQGTGTGEGNVVFVGQSKESSPGAPPVSGAGTRMMWYPDKAAFRVGKVDSNQWDQANAGYFSFATGINSIALGYSAIAMGDSTRALEDRSTAIGYHTIASGFASTAMGNRTTASYNYSTAMGNSTTASGSNSTAMGIGTNAFGHTSTALGFYTTASGINSTAMGENTIASGTVSTAMGIGTTSSGIASTALAYNTSATSFAVTTIGRFNVGGGNATSWVATDPLFEIGIGTSGSARRNALTVLKIGNTGIGTHTPTALLHTLGTGTGEGNVVFVGEFKSTSPGAPPVSGAGTRMMWYPDKAAFRAGRVSLNQWDQGNVGNYSFATGFETTASGNLSTAMGYYSTASGYYSIAMGRSSTASGVNSTAIGDGANASSLTSVAVGSYNLGGGNPSTWVATDPIFEIGIGNSSVPKNALTVLKNGNTGIGTHTPKAPLHVEDRIRVGEDPSYAAVYGELIHEGGGTGFKINANAGGGWADLHLQTDGNTRMFIESGGNVGIGTTTPGYKLTVNGTAWCSAGAWTGSDIRWKRDINPMSKVLPRVMDLQAVNYFLRTEEFPGMGFSTDPQIGLIAQEVEKIFPQLVSTDPNGFKSIAYDKLSVLLLEAVKEQQTEIESLKQEKLDVNARLERLERALESLGEK